MTERPSKEKIEQVALLFAAQMVDFSNNGKDSVVDDDISNAAMQLAIDWGKREEARLRIFQQQWPNWIDLSELDVSNLDLDPEKYYWFEARPMSSPHFTVVQAKFIRSVKTKVPSGPKRLIGEMRQLAIVEGIDGNQYISQYVIIEDGRSIYTEDYKPELPEAVKAQVASDEQASSSIF